VPPSGLLFYPQDRLQWVQNQPSGERVFTIEPGSAWNRNLSVRAVALLINEEML